MTRRGRAVLVLGLAVYLVAWAFGARALYPVATGLVLAVALAVAWVRLAARPPAVRRRGAARETLEGDDVRIDLQVDTRSLVPPPGLAAREENGRLGQRIVDLARVGPGRYAGAYEIRNVPRGRYPFGSVRLSIHDPFALAHAELVEEEPQALVVYPRLVEVRRPFAERGQHAQDGRRLLLHRPAGFELHSVRDHEQGESLRHVHWPSTARRGSLMVKELEDAPRDEIAVLLDGDASAAVGEAPESSFDVAVRAAGSLLLTHVRRGRRCVLVVNSARRETRTIGSEADWQRARELLAAVEPTARTSAAALLGLTGGAAAQALELVVVTSRLERSLAERLVERAHSRRGAALVYVEPESFAGRPGQPQPALLRLQAAGVPVAVVRRGDDLAAALELAPDAEAARG